MRPLSRVAALASGAMLVAVLANADAPIDQYSPFSPSASTILDVHTYLTWQRSVKGPVPATSASAACSSGFRLPTYRELLTIVDEDPHDEWDPVASKSTSRYIDPNAFPGTPGAAFWTMSPRGATDTMGVNFSTGETSDLGPSDQAYVRCVKP